MCVYLCLYFKDTFEIYAIDDEYIMQASKIIEVHLYVYVVTYVQKSYTYLVVYIYVRYAARLMNAFINDTAYT